MKFFDRNVVILKLAQEIMRKPKAWTTAAWARDADGNSLNGENFAAANSPKACAWCYEGAVMKAAGDLGYNEHDARAAISQCDWAYYEANRRGSNRAGLMDVNDKDGKTETLAAMTKAINRLERAFKAEQKAAKNC